MKKWMMAWMVLALSASVACGTESSEDDSATDGTTESMDGASEESNTPAEGEAVETGEEQEEAESDEPVGAPLGSVCEEDSDCQTPSGYPTCITTTLIKTLGLSDTAEVPSGYCSDMTCDASADCGEENVQCVDLDASGVTDLFNICLKGCEAGEACGEDQECYCDADQGILNTEGDSDFCTCMPGANIQLLTE